MVPPLFASHLAGFSFAILFIVFYDLGTMKYIDAHCHILSDVQMRDAVARGVVGFVVNATQPDDWNAVIKLAQNDNVFGAVGVHPWYVSGLHDGWDNDLVSVLTAHPNLMVGEIGLDKNHPDIEKQIFVFKRQIQIAHDMGRVAHIHVVGAWGNIIDVLHRCDLPPAMVFHAFSASGELISELNKMGAYFSFGADVLNESHVKARAAVASVPENRILVESDAPDGAMPDKIPDIVAEIAHIRGIPVADMATTIYNNTAELLNAR